VLHRFRAAAAPRVELVVTRHDGHAGFASGGLPWRARFWAEETTVSWLEQLG
jgi:predicted alpha/beta-fold hydrolase